MKIPWHRYQAGWTPLMLACRGGHVQVVDLLQRGAHTEIKSTKGWTALMMACKRGNLSIISLLLEKQADIGVTNEEGCTCLMTASYYGHTDVVDFLLTLPSMDVQAEDQNGFSVLSYACKAGKVDVVRTLLKHPDIDVDQRSHDIGHTALMVACFKGHTESVELLLSKHAGLNIRSLYGWTALHYACIGGHVPTVKVVLSHGADLNTQSEDGWTPLMSASCEGHLDVVQELLKGGANPDVKNNKGQTALSIAHNGLQTAVIEVLQKCTNVDVGGAPVSCTDSSLSELDVQGDIMQRERRAMLENRRIFREMLDNEPTDIEPPKSLSHPSTWQQSEHLP